MRILRAVLASLLVLSLAPAGALADPDRTGAVSPGTISFAWDGPMATGHSTARDPSTCSHNPDTYCDQTLIKVDTPAGSVAEMKVTTGGYSGPQCTPAEALSAPCDFSLWLYHSDAEGKAGKPIGSSANDSGEDEVVAMKRATPGYYLAIVYYYTVVQASYKGTATLGNVVLPAAPAPAAPAAPVAAAFPAAGDLKASVALFGPPSAKAIPAWVTCSIVCKGTVVAELSAAQARKLGLGRRKLVVGRAAFSVTSADGVRVVVKPSRKYAAKLARGAKLTLRAVASGDGKSATAVRAVAVKRRR
jgi:hypothetical protein